MGPAAPTHCCAQHTLLHMSLLNELVALKCRYEAWGMQLLAPAEKVDGGGHAQIVSLINITIGACSYSPQLKKWIEVGNSGMFRPEMLRPMGIPEDVNVIAWGLGLER